MATTQAEILGIKIQVDTSELPKLQAAAKDAGVGIKELSDAQEEAGRKSEEHSGKQEKLSDALGTSRRQASLLTSAVLDVAGASPQATQAVEAFASGMTGVGLATVVATAAIAAAKQAIDDHLNGLRQEQAQLALAGTNLKEYAERTRELRVETALLTDAQEIFTKGVGVAALNLGNALNNIDRYATSELYVAANQRTINDALLEADAKSIAAAKSQGDYAIALRKTAEDLAPLTFNGQKFNDLLPQQQEQLLKTAAAMGEASQKAQALGHDLLLASDDAEEFQNAITKAGEATHLALDAASKVQDEMRTGSRAEVAADVGRRTQESWDKSRAALTAYANEAKKQAEAQTQLDTERIAIQKIAGESAVNTFDLIVQHAGDAADAVKLVKMWESTLQPEIRQRIDILVASHLDSFLASLLGGRGFAPGGHQQGNEWNFTFEGEDPATRKAFLDKWGGNEEAARKDWYEQHQKDVEAKGVPKPDDWKNPYNPANSGNQDIARSGTGIGGTRGGSTIVINYTAEGFHTGREEELRANLLPVMERINRELNGR